MALGDHVARGDWVMGTFELQILWKIVHILYKGRILCVENVVFIAEFYAKTYGNCLL
jgi:hypothetical protein